MINKRKVKLSIRKVFPSHLCQLNILQLLPKHSRGCHKYLYASHVLFCGIHKIKSQNGKQLKYKYMLQINLSSNFCKCPRE